MHSDVNTKECIVPDGELKNKDISNDTEMQSPFWFAIRLNQ